MGDKVNHKSFKWLQPSEYLTLYYPKSLFSKILFLFKKRGSRIAMVTIDESGLSSEAGGVKHTIPIENIHAVEFDHEQLYAKKTFRVLHIYYWEDLINKIPDKSSFALPDSFDSVALKEFFTKRGIAVEDFAALEK